MVFLMAFCDKLTQCYNITIRFSTNTYEQFEFHCGKIFYVIKAKVVAAMTNSIDKYYLDWGFEIAPSPNHLVFFSNTRISVYTWKFHIVFILF